MRKFPENWCWSYLTTLLFVSMVFFWAKIPMHNRIRSDQTNLICHQWWLITLWFAQQANPHRTVAQKPVPMLRDSVFFHQFFDYLLLLNYFHFKQGRKRERYVLSSMTDAPIAKKAPLTRTWLSVNALLFEFFFSLIL